MAAIRAIFRYDSSAAGLSRLVLRSAALLALWLLWRPAATGLLGLSLAYVLAVWIAAAGLTFGMYLAFSMAPFPRLLSAAVRASAHAMWVVPGLLLLASRWPAGVALGLAAVVNSARLLALYRPPKGKTVVRRRRRSADTLPLLFGNPTGRPVDFWEETAPILAGALALQTGVYALVAHYPLLAAATFSTAVAIWVGTSVARGAMDARTAVPAPYSAPGVLLTLLVSVTLTAVLVQTVVVRENPAAPPPILPFLKDETPGTTAQVLARLTHTPPAPMPPANAAAPPRQTVVTQVVDPTPALVGGGNGIPGVVLRPHPKRAQKPPLIEPGAHLQLAAHRPLAFPFTGEYELFRTSSGGLPTGAAVETGTPLDTTYGTTNGGSMETVAVQDFEPPIDLTHCATVTVTVNSGEVMPLLASMKLVTETGAEDAGTELMGMKKEETLEFTVPVTGKPLLVRAIRISFERPAIDRDKNVRVALRQFTLLPRGY